jgi:hypothetical protein
MPQLAKIETTQIRLEKPELEAKLKTLEEKLASVDQRKQAGYLIFLVLFAAAIFIQENSARLMLWAITGLGVFGYHHYIPQEKIDLQAEKAQVEQYLKMFKQRERKQEKKKARKQKKEVKN